MNQKEKRIAEQLAQKLSADRINCPGCGLEAGFEEAPNRFQVKCGGCQVTVTVYVQETSSRVFDKQRQAERAITRPPVEVKPPKRNKRLAPLVEEVENKIKERYEYKGERFPKREKKQRPS